MRIRWCGECRRCDLPDADCLADHGIKVATHIVDTRIPAQELHTADSICGGDRGAGISCCDHVSCTGWWNAKRAACSGKTVTIVEESIGSSQTVC